MPPAGPVPACPARELSPARPGRQHFVPAGLPRLLGPPLPGSGSLAACPTASPRGPEMRPPAWPVERKG